MQLRHNNEALRHLVPSSIPSGFGVAKESELLTRYGMNRRSLLQSSIAAPFILTAASKAADEAAPFTIQNGRIRQSVMGWCFKPMAEEALIRACKTIGLAGIEGVSRKSYPLIRDLGMEISLVGSHGFKKGPCSPAHHEECRTKLLEAIDVAVEYKAKSVITFTGMSNKDLDPDTMDKNCIELWKSVISKAEKSNINIVLEHLNSRDNSHPMKGHPGYYGDDVDHCAKLVKAVGSPNMKLLFDCYHVSVMNGDIIRRIDQYKDIVGHYHTAGNPGRGELDDTQEINYPPIMKAILATGYEGFVAQEFIPTWDDPLDALRHAAQVCDV